MMRRMILVSLVAFLSVSVLISCAGIDPMKKVMDKVERKIDRKVDASIDKGIDEVEGAVKGGSDGSAEASAESQTKSAEQEGQGESASSSDMSNIVPLMEKKGIICRRNSRLNSTYIAASSAQIMMSVSGT
jgi:hypothetical protein